MIPPDLLDQLQNLNLIYLFFKAFAVLLAFFYLVYAIVALKQVEVLGRTVQSGGNAFLGLIAFTQFLVGVVLVLMAIFLI